MGRIGNCNATIIYFVFDFILNILTNEYVNIVLPSDEQNIKKKVKKIKKRNISLTNIRK